MDERGSDLTGRDTDAEPIRRRGYPRQPQYPYMPSPPAKRSKTPVVLTGIGGLVLGLFVGYGAGHGSKAATAAGSVVTTTITTGGPASAPAAAAHTSAAAPASAKIGGSIALTGMRGDEKLTVTLVKVADPATSSDQYMQPQSGKRWVAVQIRITNTAATAYSDSPTNGATLVDAQGQRYSSTFGDTTLGQAMDGAVKLAPGASALGVIVYEVPTGEKAATFQFSLDSGFADQTGQWQLA
ncbi:hypothetical protein ABH920_001253 [Catenulispora sp. EB89]|uniref:DUF4352 domain-containing protein n=1 Tax=Catenulispora sp. EB89 TaxID=3156257 RepID=UPI003519557D